MFLEWTFIHKVLQRCYNRLSESVMKIRKITISFSSSSSSRKRPTARLVGPKTMIHSLPCTGPFHKINAGYEVTTTTVNSSCLMYGYYLDATTKLTRDQYAPCTNLRMYIRMHVSVFVRKPSKNVEQVQKSFN